MSLRACILTLILLPLSLLGQVDEALEQWAIEMESESQAEAMADELSELGLRRPNLNDTTSLSAIPLLSPFQQAALRNYIILYGPLLSHKELRMIPGFDSATIALLENLTVVEPCQGKRNWRIADGNHLLLTMVGGTLEEAKGYRDSTYEGDRLQFRMVYSYNLHNHISFRIAADKDPTEPWGKGNYYGYHLMINDIGRLEKLIVGRYNLQFGQGLTLWTGLAPFNLVGGSSQRFSTGVRQANTFYEEGYQEGVAATVRLPLSMHLSAFASKVHGTRLLGGHAEYRDNHFIIGMTVVHTALDDSIAPAYRVYNADYFRGNRLFNAGVDIAYQWNWLMLYGEAAVDREGDMAGIGGVRLMLDNNNNLSVSYRRYSPQYHNLAAQPYGIGGGRNEQGWNLDARLRLPLKITAMLSADLHSFPSLRYGSYKPSEGNWLRAQLGRQLSRHIGTTIRYSYRGKERNIPYCDSATYASEQTLRQQLQGELYADIDGWRISTRAAYSQFESENGVMQKGWLASQQARYTHRALQVTAAATLFDVDGYYARMYLTESNLQYNFNMPMYYGRGVRFHTLLRYNIGRHTSLGVKYAITHYFDRDVVGSGAAQTDGPNRQTVYIQMRWRF